MRFTTPRSRIKDQKVVIHLLVNLHDPRFIAAPITVIRRRKYSHYLLLVTPVEAVHDKLMRPCYQLKTVCVIKILRDVLAEGESGATR